MWARVIDTNVMAHVRAARALVPGWLETGGGRFVVTASAAGLLTMIGSAPYSVTKHAAVALRRVAVGHVRRPRRDRPGDLPAGRADPDARGGRPAPGPAVSRDAALTPDQVADAWVASLADDRFLVLPHPEVAGYYAARAQDTDRWLAGMRRLQHKVDDAWRPHDRALDDRRPRARPRRRSPPGTPDSGPGEIAGELRAG